MSYLKIAMVAGIASLVCASSALADPHSDALERAKPGAVPLPSTGTNNGATCKVSFVTASSPFTPPDDLNNLSTSPQSYRALAVSALKPCSGNVFAFFTTEISTSGSGAFIHVTARATCVATGGLVNACTVGQVVLGDPGHTFMETNQLPTLATHSANFVFPNLARGQWRFEMDVGGNGTAFVDFRTLIVEMFGT